MASETTQYFHEPTHPRLAPFLFPLPSATLAADSDEGGLRKGISPRRRMEVGRGKKRPTWVSVAGERKRRREWWVVGVWLPLLLGGGGGGGGATWLILRGLMSDWLPPPPPSSTSTSHLLSRSVIPPPPSSLRAENTANCQAAADYRAGVKARWSDRGKIYSHFSSLSTLYSLFGKAGKRKIRLR